MPVVLPSLSAINLDRGGCYGTGAGNIGGNDSIVSIDSGYMTENNSYFITVVVEKHPRKAYFTQEVVISPGDPPEVEIRYHERTHKKNKINKVSFFDDLRGLLAYGIDFVYFKEK